MQGLLAVAAGGMVGAVSRYLVVVTATKLFGHGFPYGTLIVNVAGSFAMGALVETMALVWSASNEARLLLVVGLLGSFTTFSTFSLDFVTLFDRRDFLALGIYATGSFVLSVGALMLGLTVMRRLLAI